MHGATVKIIVDTVCFLAGGMLWINILYAVWIAA